MTLAIDSKPLPPGNRSLPLLGETLAFLRDAFAFVGARVARHGPVFRTHLLGRTTVILAGPRVSRVFLDEALTQRDASMPPHVQALFGGRSLPLLDGEEHRARKKQVLAAFVREAMPGYVPAMQQIVEASLAAWAREGEVRGVDELKRLAITVIARNMTSLPPGPDLDVLLAGFKAVTAAFAGLPIALPGTAYKRGLAARDAIFTILRRLVAEHRASPHDDGLARILSAPSSAPGDGADDGATIADEDAVRELHHVFIAGYIVFAELAALLLRLAERPETRAALAAEVAAHAPSGPITARAIAQMPLLDRVVQETKRLTPVVPIAFGRARTTFELEGYRIPEGTMLYWAPWSHDQDPGTFPEPAVFDPDRFAPPRAEHLRHEEGFAPQGMGAPLGHLCPGVDYATLFMKVFAVAVLRGWSWTLPEQDLALAFGKLPPEPADGLRVVFERGAAGRATIAPSRSTVEAAAPSEAVVLGPAALTALAAVVWADGTMADEELDALVRIGRATGLSPDELAGVERAMRERAPDDGTPLGLDAASAEHLFSLACLVAASDGTIDPRERVAVTALGDRLGLDASARVRASIAAHAVAQALDAPEKALTTLAAELEHG